tara:strand:+ start:1356 stop:2915 length:1560 start_codon:yes stop_codon:yes gene_type:complete
MKVINDTQKTYNTVIILDYGSQYSKLIARRVRECNVYSEIINPYIKKSELEHLNIKGIILSGGPSDINNSSSPKIPDWLYDFDVPILGICYGLQAIIYNDGGIVSSDSNSEYGNAEINLISDSDPLFQNCDQNFNVWMSHGDSVSEIPKSYELLASTDSCKYAAVKIDNIYGIQFHPEVVHTQNGKKIISNFVNKICKIKSEWTSYNFINTAIDQISNQVGNDKVLCAISGGVDSSVTAALINKAINENLICLFVNNGLLRKNEAEEVVNKFKDANIKVEYIDATEIFVSNLNKVVDPEQKRKIIGNTFISVFESFTKTFDDIKFLAQGTLYPDVIESATEDSPNAAKIKTHHNVGGLPENMNFELIEPLRNHFKDEVRLIGKELGLPDFLINRQPFPGPGLAIRIIGEITFEKLEILRNADWVLMDEIKNNDLYDQLWQSFAVLLDVHSVGVMGDHRTYEYTIAIRAVKSEDAMTADWARIPYEVLDKISSRITNEVSGVNRVVYDITSKPPSTIEWE